MNCLVNRQIEKLAMTTMYKVSCQIEKIARFSLIRGLESPKVKKQKKLQEKGEKEKLKIKTQLECQKTLLAEIKKQDLKKYLPIVGAISYKRGLSTSSKLDIENEHLADIIRRYGKPENVIDSNTGAGNRVKKPKGGYYSAGYEPVFKKKYWNSLLKKYRS